jgi:hypothetical protein
VIGKLNCWFFFGILTRLESIAELTLDGNEVANPRYYRECVLDRVKTLKMLDMRRVTEEVVAVLTLFSTAG